MTREDFEKLKHGDILHLGPCTKTVGPRGGVKYVVDMYRVSGKMKTWKTRPDEFKLPIKHGFYDSGVYHRAYGKLRLA